MRSMVVVCLLTAGALGALTACGPNYPAAESAEPEPDPTLGWPKDAKTLVVHLNSWNHAELEAYERPDLDLQKHLNAKVGDAAEWIERHREKLGKLGVSVRWNAEARVYEIER